MADAMRSLPAAAILVGLLASDAVARFLQRHLSQILGPVLILVGMLLLGMLGTRLSLNLAGFLVLPGVTFANVPGTASYNIPVGAFPTGTKVHVQGAVVDFTTPRIYLTNTALIQVQ